MDILELYGDNFILDLQEFYLCASAVTPENLDKFLKAIGREPAYVDFEV